MRERKDSGMSGVYVLADANKFKPINDTYGHEAGNIALRAIANKLKEIFAGSEVIVGRIGGDEFAVFVEGMIADVTAKFPKNEHGDPYLATNFNISEKSHEVTASIGMAAVSATDELDEVVKVADSSMYESKRKGVHRVMKIDRGSRRYL